MSLACLCFAFALALNHSRQQLGEYLSNFQTVIPEITLAPSASGLLLKSFMSNQSVSVEGAGARALYTNMELPSSIFADYRVPFADPMELTVTLREFKAFVAFGDVIARPLVVKFTATGQPIALSMTGTVGFSADMMLATVSNADEDATASAVSAATSVPTSANIKVKKAPVVKQQPNSKTVPTTGNNNADDENSSSYYYSYDTSMTDAGQQRQLPPALPPVTKKEKIAAKDKVAATKPAAANARRASAPSDMLIDNTEQPTSDTARTGERGATRASHMVDVDDEPLEFPPSPTRDGGGAGVEALFREPSPEI
jgi:hypothetical protein